MWAQVVVAVMVARSSTHAYSLHSTLSPPLERPAHSSLSCLSMPSRPLSLHHILSAVTSSLPSSPRPHILPHVFHPPGKTLKHASPSHPREPLPPSPAGVETEHTYCLFGGSVLAGIII